MRRLRDLAVGLRAFTVCSLRIRIFAGVVRIIRITTVVATIVMIRRTKIERTSAILTSFEMDVHTFRLEYLGPEAMYVVWVLGPLPRLLDPPPFWGT